MTYSGLVLTRPSASPIRRPVAACVAAVVLSTAGAAPALAQDSLPDPDAPAKKAPAASKSQDSSDLPTTGIETGWLVLSGVALLAGGLAVRPAARLRRSYRTDTWENLVRPGS